MSILNIGLSALSLTLDPNCDEWLIKEVLAGASSMKTVRKNIEDYDKEFCLALSTIERRLRMAKGLSESDDLDYFSDGDSTEFYYLLGIGKSIKAFIDYFGWHVGTVKSVRQDEALMNMYTIQMFFYLIDN